MQAGLWLSVLLTPRLPGVDRQRVESSELLTGRIGWRPATACAWSGMERMGLGTLHPRNAARRSKRALAARALQPYWIWPRAWQAKSSSASAAGLISLDSARALCISLRTSHLTKEVEAMDIKRIGSQPSTKGSTDWFTGTVRIDPLYDTPEPSRVSCASVTFEPGSRTAWHTHSLGQTLIVTMGCGWVQE